MINYCLTHKIQLLYAFILQSTQKLNYDGAVIINSTTDTHLTASFYETAFSRMFQNS